MGWFSKQSKSCPHDETGPCARCVIGDADSGIEQYVSLDPDLILECVAPLPAHLNERMREHGKEIILAGGFIRDTLIGVTPKDVDIFCAKARADKFIGHYEAPNTGNQIAKPGKSSYSAYIGQTKYQFIYRFKFDSPEALLNQFDYSICRAAIWYDRQGKEWTGISWHSWATDAASKHLVFLDHEPEQEAILRLLELTKRGYTIGELSLARALTGFVGAMPAASTLDLEAFEAELVAGFEALREKNRPKVESTPYKKPKVVDTDWGGS
jgi:hypothetical protein